MIDFDAEATHVAPLMQDDGKSRSLLWRGCLFVERQHEYWTTVVHAGGGPSDWVGATPSVSDALDDDAWLRDVLTWIANNIKTMRLLNYTSRDRVPWEIHEIENLTAYLTALSVYDRSRS